MKVLFIRSGNNVQHPISTLQGNSLQKIGLSVEYYDIVGKGILGYLSNVIELRKCIKAIKPDVLHAHYSLSAFVTTLASTNIPIVVSLMGSDVYNSDFLTKITLKIFKRFWESTIVKSEKMYLKLGDKRALIIPNGVDLSFFNPMSTNDAREKLSWDQQKTHILFASDPKRPEKNFALAKLALRRLHTESQNFKIHFLVDIPMDEMVYYYNAADLLLMTSIYEGSPNVIKEAMACNCPIVSTCVGDIKWVLGDTEGCYLATFDPSDVADKIIIAIDFAEKKGRTAGKERILKLGLESETVANRILDVYSKIKD